MKNILKPIFKDVVNHHIFDYAERIFPSIVFCNAMIDGDYANDATIKFVENLYAHWDERERVFSEKIVSDYMKRIPKEYIAKIKGSDIYNAIVFWLSYLLGIVCSSEKADKAFRLLRDMFYSYDGQGFYLGYKPKRNVMKFFIKQMDLSPQKMLINGRVVNNIEEADIFIEHEQSYPKERSIMDICREISRTIYIHSLEDESMILSYLLDARMYGKWIDIVINLKLPCLQKEFCETIRDSEVILMLYEELTQRKDDDTDTLRYLLMNEWFRVLVSEKVIYLNPAPKRGEEVVVDIFNSQKDYFDNSLDKTIQKGITIFSQGNRMDEVCKWAFPKNKRREVNDSNKAYNFILEKIQDYTYNKSEVGDLNIEVRDISYLAKVAHRYVEKEVNIEPLLEKILTLVESDDFRWPSSLEENDMYNMRALAKLFSEQPTIDYTEKVMDRFSVKYEGVKITNINDWPRKASRESYVFCALLLMSEIETIDIEIRAELFRKIASELIRQCHCCSMELLVQNYYQSPLILAELIVDQILNECKEDFEIQLVKKVYAKDVVLETIACSKQPIAQEVIVNLNEYQNLSWNNFKRMLTSKRQNKKKVERMETILSKTCNNK